ncbi:hypothetical protein ACNZ61_002137 [Enterococcus hirae]
MQKKHKIVIMEYPVATNPDHEFSLLTLEIEFIAEQSKYSYELDTDFRQLRTKERRKLKQLIRTFQKPLEENKNADLSDLSRELKKLINTLRQEYPEDSDIAMYSTRIVGSYYPYHNAQFIHDHWSLFSLKKT